MNRIFVIELLFPGLLDISGGLSRFFETYADSIEEIVNVTTFTTAHQVSTLAGAVPEYRLHYVIMYTGTEIRFDNATAPPGMKSV